MKRKLIFISYGAQLGNNKQAKTFHLLKRNQMFFIGEYTAEVNKEFNEGRVIFEYDLIKNAFKTCNRPQANLIRPPCWGRLKSVGLPCNHNL